MSEHSRLIDANALKEKIEQIHPWEPYPSKYAEGIRHCMELAIAIIDGSPTIEPDFMAGAAEYAHKNPKRWTKTERHFPEVAQLIEKMKESE